MGWFDPKCPRCGGALQETGYCAPYPTHRCPSCIAAHKQQAENKDLRARIEKLERATHSTSSPALENAQ